MDMVYYHYRFLNSQEALVRHRAKHPKIILFGDLNANLLRNKFEYLEEIIKNMLGFFLVSECKLDLSFPDTQFQIANYNMYRKG